MPYVVSRENSFQVAQSKNFIESVDLRSIWFDLATDPTDTDVRSQHWCWVQNATTG